VPKPILVLEVVRLHPKPVYSDAKLVGVTSNSPPEVRGTLYLQGGGTMKLFQTVTAEEQQELEALLERISARILATMTVALGSEQLPDPQAEE
jgi:hypothetical protein